MTNSKFKIDFTEFDSVMKEISPGYLPTMEQTNKLKEASKRVEDQVLIAAQEKLSDAVAAVYVPNNPLKCWMIYDARSRNIGFLWVNKDNTAQITTNPEIHDRMN